LQRRHQASGGIGRAFTKTTRLGLNLSRCFLIRSLQKHRIHPVGAAGMALSELTAPSGQAARASGIRLRQFHGSSAARSVILWSAIRASTSASQAWGSTSLSLAV